MTSWCVVTLLDAPRRWGHVVICFPDHLWKSVSQRLSHPVHACTSALHATGLCCLALLPSLRKQNSEGWVQVSNIFHTSFFHFNTCIISMLQVYLSFCWNLLTIFILENGAEQCMRMRFGTHFKTFPYSYFFLSLWLTITLSTPHCLSTDVLLWYFIMFALFRNLILNGLSAPQLNCLGMSCYYSNNTILEQVH